MSVKEQEHSWLKMIAVTTVITLFFAYLIFVSEMLSGNGVFVEIFAL